MEIIAYTDGSYKEFPDIGPLYSGAAVVIADDPENPQVCTTVGNDARYLPLHNIAGEIAAVMLACEHCLNTLHVTQQDTLIIAHDYVGIANWCMKAGEPGYWRATKPLTQFYRDYMNQKVKTRCRVVFQHVKGHSTSRGNELADKYAKSAMEEYINNHKKGV